MPFSATVRESFNVDGVTGAKTYSYSEEAVEKLVVAATQLNTPRAGTLSTRTDNDTGVVTAASHGLSGSDTVDVWWSAGKRVGMSITNVSGNLVTVDGGNGDNLPTQDTAVTIVRQKSATFNLVGSALSVFTIESQYQGVVAFYDASGTYLTSVEITSNGGCYIWHTDSGVTNPFDGVVVASVKISNKTTAGLVTMTCFEDTLS